MAKRLRAHRLMLSPRAPAAAATAACTSGETRSMSLPEYGFCAGRPCSSPMAGQ